MEFLNAASILRGLHGHDVPIPRKVALGHSLQVALALSSEGSPFNAEAQEGNLSRLRTELAATPPRVRKHYIKTLLEWTTSTLLKAASSSGKGKAAARGADDADAVRSKAAGNTLTRVAARLWSLLAALLRMHKVGPGAAANPALVSAAAHACHTAAEGALCALGGDVNADLADALLDALRLLAAKDRLRFSPSLEHSVAFVEAAVEAMAVTGLVEDASAAERESWVEVCAQSLVMLRSVCLSHPNQRKVYVSVLERLCIPLLPYCGPQGSGVLHGQRRLVMASRQLLEAVIFHPAHLEALAVIASNQQGSKRPENATEPAKTGRQGTDEDVPAEEQGQSHGSPYASLIFQELSREVGQAGSVKLQLILAGLPWLLVRFKAALKRNTKALANSGRDAVDQGKGHARGGTQAGSSTASADFGFFSLLLEPLLARLQSAAKGTEHISEQHVEWNSAKGADSELPKRRLPPEQAKRAAKKRKLQSGAAERPEAVQAAWSTLAEGAGLLVSTLKTAGVYRATEDVTGSHRNLLERLGTAMLLPFTTPEAKEEDGAEGRNKRLSAADILVGKAAASTGVLGAIMDVEHRALHARLDSLWDVVWLSASQTAAAGVDSIGRGADVAARLVRVYGELRQVETLLHSLLASLRATTCTAAATRVIDSAPVKAALHQTIYEAPQGQKPKIVAFAAAGVLQLLAANDAVAPAFLVLLRGCLAGLRIDLTTSAALASALEHLISRSLAPPLNEHLRKVTHKCAAHIDRRELAALLQLYALATRAHAACAALQPQIASLPGHAHVVTVHASPLENGQSPALGYFDALHTGSRPLLPSVPSLVGAVGRGGSEALLKDALNTCMLQRMEVLHERLMHLRFSCPFQQEGQPHSTEMSGPDSSKDPGTVLEQDICDLEAETAAELTELADNLVAMVAPFKYSAHAIEQPAAGGGTDLPREGKEGLSRVLLSSELLFQHASSAQRASLLRLLLSLSLAPQPCGAETVQPLHADDEVHTAATRVLHSAELLKEPHMEMEWVHAAAAIIYDSLSAACGPSVSSGKSRPGRSAAAATDSRPKRKGKGTSQDENFAQAGQGSQDANALQHLILSVGRLALPQPDAPSSSISGCDAILNAVESCTRNTVTAAPSTGSAHPTALQQISHLFTELACLPAQFFAARGCMAAELTNLALLAEAGVMTLMRSGGSVAQTRMTERNEVAGLLNEECLGALQATHEFLATVAGSGSMQVLNMLSQLAQAHLHWPFMVTRHALSAADVGGSAAMWQHITARSMLDSSAVIMGSIARHGLAGGGMHAADMSANDAASHDGGGGKFMHSTRRFLEDMMAKMAASSSGSSSVEAERAVQILTLAAAVVASMAGPCADAKRRAASSIVAGPVDHAERPSIAAEVHVILDSLELLCVHGLETASQQVVTGKQSGEGNAIQQEPASGNIKEWQKPDEASSIASLLGAAATLLDARMRERKGSKGPEAAHNDMQGGGQEEGAEKSKNSDLPSIMSHVGRHIHLSSRFLMATWHLQGEDSKGDTGTLSLQAALDVVAYLKTAARALPSLQDELPRDITRRLFALHIHLLGHLQPLPPVPGPHRQLNMGLLMNVPTLDAEGGSISSSTSAAHSMLREALLLSVREVVQASTLADQEQLYHSVQCMLLDENRSLAATLPILEVLLVAMESVHSTAALRVLSQSAEDLAAALLSCMHAAPAPAAASQCTALRCLESLMARASAIELPGHIVSQTLQAPALLFPAPAIAHSKAHRSAGIFAGCCHLLVATVRHRTTQVRRCMALAAATARALLMTLLTWRSAGSADLARQCAEELSSVYEAIAERKDLLGMYCHHLLADYITLAAAPAKSHSAAEDDWTDARPSSGLWPAAAAALRPGACALYGACSPAQVQHVFAILHRTGGGTHRTAVTELRQDYERNLKFSGKV
ncbi:g3096 [Coccomyxa elongata]